MTNKQWHRSMESFVKTQPDFLVCSTFPFNYTARDNASRYAPGVQLYSDGNHSQPRGCIFPTASCTLSRSCCKQRIIHRPCCLTSGPRYGSYTRILRLLLLLHIYIYTYSSGVYIYAVYCYRLPVSPWVLLLPTTDPLGSPIVNSGLQAASPSSTVKT